MGVHGLWSELEPVAREISLVEFGITRALCAENGHRRARVGIDAAMFVYKALGKFKQRYPGSPPMPELQDIFMKLLRLAQTTIVPVFVFDGPDRPLVKRGRNVVLREHWVVTAFKRFLDAMGFFFFDAPGEAEAELARLSHEGLVDAVMTEDVDALVFGAKTVIRIINFGQDEFKIYDAIDCENNTRLRLTRAGMILVAVLSGGDYDKGLDGFGATTAARVARYGLGETLLEIADMSPLLRAPKLVRWRERLVHILANDPEGFLQQRQIRLSASIPLDFPNLNIVNLYYHPVIQPSPRTDPFPSDMSIGVPRPLDLDRILKLTSELLWWTTYETLSRKGINSIFPSLLTQETVSILDNPSLQDTSPITKICQSREADPGVARFRVEYDAGPYFAAVRRRAVDCPVPGSSGAISLQRMWMPVAILERTHPELVAVFLQRRSIKASTQNNKTESQPSRTPQPLLAIRGPLPLSSAIITGSGLLSPGSFVDPFETSDEEERLSDQRLSDDYHRIFGSSGNVVRSGRDRSDNDGDRDILEISSDSEVGQPMNPSSRPLLRSRSLNERLRLEAFGEIEFAEAISRPIHDHTDISSTSASGVIEIFSSSEDESTKLRTAKRARIERGDVVPGPSDETQRSSRSPNIVGPKVGEVIVLDSD